MWPIQHNPKRNLCDGSDSLAADAALPENALRSAQAPTRRADPPLRPWRQNALVAAEWAQPQAEESKIQRHGPAWRSIASAIDQQSICNGTRQGERATAG